MHVISYTKPLMFPASISRVRDITTLEFRRRRPGFFGFRSRLCLCYFCTYTSRQWLWTMT